MIEAAFRHGWTRIGAGEPRVLTERDYTEARAVLGPGGWTGLDQATIDAVRGGAQPGDSLPPLQAHPATHRPRHRHRGHPDGHRARAARHRSVLPHRLSRCAFRPPIPTGPLRKGLRIDLAQRRNRNRRPGPDDAQPASPPTAPALSGPHGEAHPSSPFSRRARCRPHQAGLYIALGLPGVLVPGLDCGPCVCCGRSHGGEATGQARLGWPGAGDVWRFPGWPGWPAGPRPGGREPRP